MNDLPPRTRRSAVAAWIFYDVAMHGYGLMIPGVAYAIYFTSHVAGDTGHADVLWSVAVSLSLVIAGLLAPWVGAVADASGRRRSLLGAGTLLCGVATALMVTVGRGDVVAGIAWFVLAQIGSILAGSLYNSYLPILATRAGTARLSGLAWGLSYLGGIACFLLCLPFIREGIAAENVIHFANSFLVTAAFVLLIGLPAVAALPSANSGPVTDGIAAPYRRILRTFKEWRHDREVPKFLLAYYLVNDAVVTVIFFTAVMMKKTFGLEVQEILMLSLAYQAIAIPATMFFGWLGGRWSQRGALYITLVLWMLTLGLIASAQGRGGAIMIALSLGVVLGSTQTIFRSMLAAMVPIDRVSEYYGFHAFMGRASSALGPLFFGAVSAVTGSQRLAMASLAAFFVAGGIVLAMVRIPGQVERDRQP
jgi:UMF1 family MFS transporter